MKKWLLYILFSVCFFSTTKQPKAEAEDWVSIIEQFISWGIGDGLMKECAKSTGCDDYEDLSISDQVIGIFSSNKKVSVCAANSISKNTSRIIGTAVLSALLPFPASYIVANLTGNAIQCIQAKIQANSAKQKVNKYEVCFPSASEGHPLPLTDKQIAKALQKMNMWVTVDNIVAQYSKLCLKKKDDESSYHFYNDGDVIDNVYIYHADGYPYLLCASIIDACPCIFNIQNGVIKEPEYEREKETDFIKMRPDGSLIYKGDDDKSRENEENYKSNYVKHCRLMRFKEFYEQSNDLSSIYSDACFDLHGYSKRQANITAGIVQCFEDTARNVFEKPILSVNQETSKEYNTYDIYNNEYSFVSKKKEKIINLLQGRTKDNFSTGDYPVFLSSDVSKILQLLKEIWFENNNATIVSFTCSSKGNAIRSGYKTNLYNKYIIVSTNYSTSNCCSNNKEIYETCYGDVYKGSLDEIKPSITEDQTEISLPAMFDEIEKVNTLTKHIKDLTTKASKAQTVVISKSGFTLTLFDLLRNKIKVLAVIALVFWMFIFGWKMINGDYGKIKTQEFGMIALRVFLCYMVVFSDNTKNLLFNVAIQTSQGVGMFFNEIMSEFRSQKDNKYNNVCNMRQNSRNTPKKIYGDIISANSSIETKYVCQEWEEKVCHKSSGTTSCICEEYKMSCQDSFSTLNCKEYFKDYNGVENKNYCKTGTCSSKDGYIKANIYKTGISRQIDQYPSYTFSCPSESEDYGCEEYKTFFGNKQCIKRNCKKFTLACDDGQTLSCKRYNILPDGEYGSCISGVCVQNRATFVPIPPMERPYKIKSYYSVNSIDGIMTYQPYCHKKVSEGSEIQYEENDPIAKQSFSSMLGSNVFICNNENYELDDGFRIKEYIRHGIIPDKNESILVFQTLLPTSTQSADELTKVSKLKQTPIPTAVATSDIYGNIIEYNFIDDNKAIEGQQRAKYRIYIKSLFSYINKNSAYPKIKEYGSTRDYSHLSFWDSMDCKIIQFISMQGFGGDFTEDINDVISGVKDGDGTTAIASALNGMLQFLKFMFMSFPFGILVFILMFAIGASLFMLVARATQQYCICVFNLVMIIYLSPFVFLLWLFDQTKNVMKTWIGDIQKNILGACVPFISISMFLYVIDWLFFGDVDKYVSMKLFLPSGEINGNCYDGNLSEAPIACLTKRCLNTFTWLGLIGLNQGGSVYSIETVKMLGYLVLRCLFAAGIIMALTSMLDRLENAVYDIINGKPDTDIGVGFNGEAGDYVKKGLNTGITAGKFSLFSMKTALGTVGGAGYVAFNSVWSVFSKITPNAANVLGNFATAVKNGAGDIIYKIGQGIGYIAHRVLNTERWRNHKRRLEEIDNTYNDSMAEQHTIRDNKVQQLRNTLEQQRNNNANIVNDYGNKLAQQNMFDKQQIENLKEQKMAELTDRANSIMQAGINNINQEFEQKQNELLKIRDDSKKNENDGW